MNLLLKRHPVSDEEFFENYYKSKNELEFQTAQYFERNQLDAMLYPTMPILP